MQLAEIIGRATATVKHSSMDGWRMLIAQPLGASGQDDGDPVIVIDSLGSGRGDKVMITSDGKYITQMVGTKESPIRWAVLGIAD
jgi:ethanolamine utilization protein EutN